MKKKSAKVLQDKTGEIFEKQRRIYEKQHRRIASDDKSFKRQASTYSAAKLGIKPDWFEGKVALDAGCGNIGSLIVRLAEMGCKKIYACDIGSHWIPFLSKNLKKKGLSESQFKLQAGNVIDLPYQDEQFDFVSMAGVLIHMRNMKEVERGFAEGARVCKPGGYYFTSYGIAGGLIQGAIFPAVRQRYNEDKGFKTLIDGLNPALIHGVIDKICADSVKFGGEKLDKACLKTLFTEDTCVFLQNYIQTPNWLSNECTPKYVEGLYKKYGFKKVKRLNEFVKRSELRKFFAPLHYDWDYPMSRVLYGDGYVKYIAQKT